MCDRISVKSAAIFFALLTLPMNSILAQESPKPDDPFEVEPPLLVQPSDVQKETNEVGAAQLAAQLERAKHSASAAEKLVKMGVLAKTEAEQRALRVLRLESELADAQLAAAKDQVTALQESHDRSQAELDAALATLTQATAAAQATTAAYRKALLDAAELNLSRQRQLLAMGSARRSDVARAKEKLATLQRGQTEH